MTNTYDFDSASFGRLNFILFRLLSVSLLTTVLGICVVLFISVC